MAVKKQLRAKKPSPVGGRWHGEAVTDEGKMLQIALISQPFGLTASPESGGSLEKEAS